MPLSVRLFGKLRVERDGQHLCVPAGKARELFAYLVLHPRRAHHREALAEVLFPETDCFRARRHLCDVIYRLKQALGPGWIEVDGDYLSLIEKDLWVDVWEFNGTQHGLQAIDLYGGDLLEELDATWLLGERARVRERGMILLERECRHLIARGEQLSALDLAHRWIDVEPLSEQAHCVAMQIYVQLGRFARALDQYSLLSSLLKDELGIGPSAKTRDLRDMIRHERDALASVREPLFVGRQRERAQLAQAANAALAGHGALILLDGAAGVGKTRLLEVFADSASWRGFEVTRANGKGLLGKGQVLSDLRPQTILLDDAHAAARDIWDELLDMATMISQRPVVVLLSGRSIALRHNEAAWEALRRLDDEAVLEHCRLHGLSVPECEYLAQAVGSTCSTRDVDRIHQHTGGNPKLFLDALRAGRSAGMQKDSSGARGEGSFVKVEMTRTDVPLGRALTEADRIVIELSVSTSEADEALRRKEGPTAMRRGRLRRLLAEARSQGAAPTHEDLARLLACSVRTVARDMAATGSIGTRRTR